MKLKCNEHIFDSGYFAMAHAVAAAAAMPRHAMPCNVAVSRARVEHGRTNDSGIGGGGGVVAVAVA